VSSDARNTQRLNTVADAERLAKRRLPRPVFDYIAGSAGAEYTADANIGDIRKEIFRPRMGETIGIEPRETQRTLFDTSSTLPIAVGPVGFTRSMHPLGDVAGARAANALGIPFCQSSMSGHTIEEVGAVAKSFWYQLYPLGGRQGGEQMIDRAARAGASTLVVTMDTVVPGNRERDLAYGAALPVRVNRSTMRSMAKYVAPKPRWLANAARDRFQFPLANTRGMTRDGRVLREDEALMYWIVEPPTWNDLAWMREQWKGSLVVKGVLTADDARRAVDCGVDGVIVSNHGGRQLDQTSTSIAALREIAPAVGNDVEVMMDGGIRRGSDVAVALCAGARGVLLGRSWVYGLAAGGEQGVQKVLEIVRNDFIRTMQLLGVRHVDDLGPDLLEPLAR
jgi:L-lactate dehydrogenase (cytochrome)